MNQVNKSRTIIDLSKKELMDFIMTLNKCMQDYDNDIEYRTKCSEKVEWDSIKSSPVSKRNLKRLQYGRNMNHILHNYNDKYNFENVECVIHLIRRLKKKYQETNHIWCNEMIELLSQTNQDRNELIKEKKDFFDKKYLAEIERKYRQILEKGKTENEDKTQINYFEKEKRNFIKDLIKYEKNYLLWAYHFELPSTNNNCERSIRQVKSKMKISG